MKLSIAFYSFWTFVVLAIFQCLEVTSWSWGYVLLPAAVFIGALVREMEIDIAVDKYLRHFRRNVRRGMKRGLNQGDAMPDDRLEKRIVEVFRHG